MSEQTTDVNKASQRHWLYGFNLAALVAIGLVALIFLLAICEKSRAHTQWDWSSNKLNSLSGSTKKMLAELNTKGKDYKLLALFPDPSDEDKRNGVGTGQAERRRQINDLLQQYARNSSHITAEDAGDRSRDDVEREIRDRFKTDLAPYQDAVKDFDKVAKDLGEFLKTEAAGIGAVGQKQGIGDDEARDAMMLQSQFSSEPAIFDTIRREIHTETDSILPDWQMLADAIKEKLDAPGKMLGFLSDPAQLKEKLGTTSPTLTGYFVSAQDKYKAMAAEVKAYKDKLDKLAPLKMQDVLGANLRNAVVILGADSAKAISEYDLFDVKRSQNGAPDSIVFKGEESISSALLALTKPEKVTVVFVTPSPQHISTDVYSDVAAMLQSNNFDVKDWSPPAPQGPGMPPSQDDPNPPAEGKGVVWVIFPPEQPTQQQMFSGMPPPSPAAVIAATKKHLDDGGSALFFAEASGMSMMADPSAPYVYDELVRPFGIDVKPKYCVVQRVEGQDATGKTVSQIRPYIELNHYEDHEITQPVQSLASAWAPTNGITYVGVAQSPPAGVTAKVIVQTPNDPDFWAESTFSQDAKFDKESDLPSPVPLAAVGSKGNQRVVVIGCKYLGINEVIEAADRPRIVGDQVEVPPAFPGNPEILKNAVLWLAGYENMIAVSAKADVAARIGDVKPGTLAMVRVGVLALAPLAALGLGGLMWMMRRR